MNKPFFELVQQDDKYVLDVSDTLNDMFRTFHQKLETLCEADFDQFARKLGYTKMEPGTVAVNRGAVLRLDVIFSAAKKRCFGSKAYRPDYCVPVLVSTKDCTDFANSLRAALDAGGDK